MILATGAVHSHLLRQGLRSYTSINVRSAECFDTHYFAVLVGVGATTVNAYLAQECIADRHARGLFGKMSEGTCVKRYLDAVSAGLLKIMSKMGISVISSYRGAYNFEAVGLSRSMVADIFPGMPSRISGIGLAGIATKVARAACTRLRRGGRRAADRRLLQIPPGRRNARATTRPDPSAADGGDQRFLRHLSANIPKGCGRCRRFRSRHLMALRPGGAPVPLEEVESITEIRKRFVTPGMSLGALSPEAHEMLNIAMNRIGAKSDSGEGGEDPARFRPKPNGDNRQFRDQAGGLGPLRRDGGISQPVPRAGDQGRAGRQARRRRAIARLQGHRDDRASCAIRRRA